jgi:phosphohistidine phosphatase
VAAWLQRHLPGDAAVLSSPARRTVQTAQALGLAFRTEEALTPDRDAHDLLAAAGWPMGRGAVLVVGHQPILGHVAALLLTGTAQPWSVRKGAVWWLRQRERAAQRETVLLAVQDADFAP